MNHHHRSYFPCSHNHIHIQQCVRRRKCLTWWISSVSGFIQKITVYGFHDPPGSSSLYITIDIYSKSEVAVTKLPRLDIVLNNLQKSWEFSQDINWQLRRERCTDDPVWTSVMSPWHIVPYTVVSALCKAVPSGWGSRKTMLSRWQACAYTRRQPNSTTQIRVYASAARKGLIYIWVVTGVFNEI